MSQKPTLSCTYETFAGTWICHLFPLLMAVNGLPSVPATHRRWTVMRSRPEISANSVGVSHLPRDLAPWEPSAPIALANSAVIALGVSSRLR